MYFSGALRALFMCSVHRKYRDNNRLLWSTWISGWGSPGSVCLIPLEYILHMNLWGLSQVVAVHTLALEEQVSRDVYLVYIWSDHQLRGMAVKLIYTTKFRPRSHNQNLVWVSRVLECDRPRGKWRLIGTNIGTQTDLYIIEPMHIRLSDRTTEIKKWSRLINII